MSILHNFHLYTISIALNVFLELLMSNTENLELFKKESETTQPEESKQEKSHII